MNVKHSEDLPMNSVESLVFFLLVRDKRRRQNPSLHMICKVTAC